jgi:hypothetical protein
MAEIVHRIPWTTPYGYTEIKLNTETDGDLDDGAAARYNAEALMMQDAHAAIFGAGPFNGGLSAAAHDAGLPPAPTYAPPAGVPAMGGTPTGYAPPAQADQVCPQCGGALGPVKQTSRGPLRECLQQVRQCFNAKGYPNSVWLTQGGRR